jgi:hypothetical protein
MASAAPRPTSSSTALAREQAFRATRRYRLAARLAGPLDRLRDRGRRG